MGVEEGVWVCNWRSMGYWWWGFVVFRWEFVVAVAVVLVVAIVVALGWQSEFGFVIEGVYEE
jgi:hypothetical protein